MSVIKWVLYDWFGYNWIFSQKIHLMIKSECAIFWLKKFSDMLGESLLFPVHFTLLIFSMYICLYFQDKPSRQLAVQHYIKHLVLLLVNMAIGLFIIKSVKPLLHYARPCCTHGFHLSEHVQQLLNSDKCITAGYSFPSGHTTYFTIFVVSFWQLMSKKFKVASICMIGLMMFSRVALGRHFVADTVYALLITLYVIRPLGAALVARYLTPYDPLIRRCSAYLFKNDKKV